MIYPTPNFNVDGCKLWELSVLGGVDGFDRFCLIKLDEERHPDPAKNCEFLADYIRQGVTQGLTYPSRLESITVTFEPNIDAYYVCIRIRKDS